MNAHHSIDGERVAIADSWAASVTEDLERSRRTAWIVAGVAAAIALLLAIAIVIMLPLKTTQPYTLLVDRQTGHVEALAPLEKSVIAPDAALTRSFLVQYVIARESFSADSLPFDYRKVGLWSEGAARTQYLALMGPNNPANPFVRLPRGTSVRTEIASVSSLGPSTSLVRFTTQQVDAGAQPQAPQHWAAVISYRFSGAEMSAEDRLLNPLGFQVTRYRRDAETPPAPPAALPAGSLPAVAMPGPAQ